MYNFVVFISDQERKKRNTHIHTFIKEKKKERMKKLPITKFPIHFLLCIFAFVFLFLKLVCLLFSFYDFRAIVSMCLLILLLKM